MFVAGLVYDDDEKMRMWNLRLPSITRDEFCRLVKGKKIVVTHEHFNGQLRNLAARRRKLTTAGLVQEAAKQNLHPLGYVHSAIYDARGRWHFICELTESLPDIHEYSFSLTTTISNKEEMEFIEVALTKTPARLRCKPVVVVKQPVEYAQQIMMQEAGESPTAAPVANDQPAATTQKAAAAASPAAPSPTTTRKRPSSSDEENATKKQKTADLSASHMERLYAELTPQQKEIFRLGLQATNEHIEELIAREKAQQQMIEQLKKTKATLTAKSALPMIKETLRPHLTQEQYESLFDEEDLGNMFDTKAYDMLVVACEKLSGISPSHPIATSARTAPPMMDEDEQFHQLMKKAFNLRQ